MERAERKSPVCTSSALHRFEGPRSPTLGKEPFVDSEGEAAPLCPAFLARVWLGRSTPVGSSVLPWHTDQDPVKVPAIERPTVTTWCWGH
ncbi:hypothetical protein P7K49_020955 [Saguinus oedipus]|uniref:Uncharacterized protein n=1 Tax=Saguinus oedipus TaxID=9490 RepID=A0ABQ9UTL1_SAGOE|nr:hypothetical protein P7K49_020955 [Saguinus oedipus]